MTLLQTFRNSLINLTSAYEIAPKASFIRACETFSVVQTTGTSCDRNAHDCSDEETYFRLRTIAVSMVFFFFFLFLFPFFLPSFTVKSGSAAGCSIKIYRPGEKTREREREREREEKKKNAFHRPDLAFPFYSRFLSRDRRAGLSNHAKNNESQRRYSVSQWFTVDGFKSISSERREI